MTQPNEWDAAVDEAVAACDGDMRAALCAVLIANAYLTAEVERLMDAVSYGFTRGKTSPTRAAAMKFEE